MNCNPIHVGVVGAGAISDIYLTNMIGRFSILQVDAVCANHLESAVRQGKKYGIRACTYEEMLADDSIEMIVNLTPTCVHYEIIKKALLAGKHVYTEKTMTDNKDTAMELLALAAEKNLYLGSAPDTFLGSALQTARKALDDGLIGDVTSCAIAANRDNNYLLSLFSFLRMPGGGVCFDYCVYYMTALVSLLGPVDRVAAIVRTPYKTHVNIVPESKEYGQVMDTPNESQVYALLQFEDGTAGTFHVNSDSVLEDQAFFAIYGTKGILYLPDPNQFGRPVKIVKNTGSFEEKAEIIELPSEYGFSSNSRGIGPAEMAWAIRENRENRAGKKMAYHVLDVLSAILESGETGQFCKVESTCERPAPLKLPGTCEEDSLHD